jgi:hypothetical protein
MLTTLTTQAVHEQVAKVSLVEAQDSSGFIGYANFYHDPAVSADVTLRLRDGFAPGSLALAQARGKLLADHQRLPHDTSSTTPVRLQHTGERVCSV